MVTIGDDSRHKTIYFGDSSLKDYTTHSPLEREERKRLYIARHRVREDWTDPFTAGFWSRWILWNKPTVKASFEDVMRRFHLTRD